MSSDQTTETTERETTDDARSRIEALEAHVSPGGSLISERLTVVRGRVTEYEEATSETERRDAMEKIQSELVQVRDAIETELDQDKSKAHDIVDDIEKKISNLR